MLNLLHFPASVLLSLQDRDTEPLFCSRKKKTVVKENRKIRKQENISSYVEPRTLNSPPLNGVQLSKQKNTNCTMMQHS